MLGQSATWAGKVALHLIVCCPSLRGAGQELKAGRNLEAGAEAKPTELTGLLSLLFLASPGPPAQGWHWPTVNWTVPPQS